MKSVLFLLIFVTLTMASSNIRRGRPPVRPDDVEEFDVDFGAFSSGSNSSDDEGVGEGPLGDPEDWDEMDDYEVL
jgi:hypothetical protein